MSYRRVTPAIRWGDNLRNRIDFGYFLDSVRAYDAFRAASEAVQAPSGVEDAWKTGTDYILDAMARWVPGIDTTVAPDPVATGWDGPAGWREMLAWARDKNVIEYHSDGRNMLRVPGLTLASDVTVTPSIGLFDKWSASNFAANSPTFFFDASVDSGRGAWRLTGTGAASLSGVDLRQFFPAAAGETYSLSADVMTDGLSGGAAAELTLIAFDVAQSSLGTIVIASGITASGGAFVRQATGISAACPAGTSFVLAIARIVLPAGASSGAVWFKNVVVRRGTTDTTYVANPSISSYLIDDNAAPPDPEEDGTRSVSLRIRNGTTPYDGY